MILEILEWCLTPASTRARTSGLLAEQIAIRHRAVRCRTAWKSHLEASKDFLVRNLPSGKRVAVLGSGHLNDVDLRHLKKNFDIISLVDVVHPLEVRIVAFFSKGRVRLLSGDLSGALHLKDPSALPKIDAKLAQAFQESDALISACVLTQLALPLLKRLDGHFPDDKVAQALTRIRRSHIDIVKNSPCGILISDTARRFGPDPWEALLPDLELPDPAARWIWDIAPVHEHGHAHLGPEQRRVEAFLFGKSPAQS